MAEENNDLEYQDEAYHKVEKSRFQAFVDIFKRPKALPESSTTKHKTTNMSIETSMSLREFRKNLVEKVGNFFQAISKIGSPKKDENLNKFATEIIGENIAEKSEERAKVAEESVLSQPRYFPGDISIKTAHEPISAETVVLAETSNEPEQENIETFDETNSSIDAGVIDIDNNFKDSTKTGIEAGTINVPNNPSVLHSSNTKQKNVIIPGNVGKTSKSVEEKDELDL